MKTEQTGHTTQAQPALDDRKRARLEKATRDFEAVFVNYLLKTMRESSVKNELFGESYGGDLMTGMVDGELSRYITQGSSLGIGEMLYRRLTGQGYPSPSATTTPVTGRIQAGAPPPSRVPHRVVPGAVRKETKKIEKPTLPLPGSEKPAQRAPLGNAIIRLPAQEKMKKGPTFNPGPRSLDERMKALSTMINEAAATHGVDSSLIKAIIATESGGKVRAESPRNAKGPMQLIDSTATALGVTRVWDPRENILAGTKYLKQQLDRFQGNVKLAAAAYNAGPGAVRKHGGIPPYMETRNYVQKVMNYMNYFQGQEADNNDDD